MLEARLEAIQRVLYASGPCSVQSLAAHVNASTATIRRDLARLEQLGVIIRSHGGARLAEASGVEVAFQTREHQELLQKRAIAEAALRLLRPGTTIFLDASTTVLQLARALRLEPVPVTVVTNGLAVAQELLGLKDVRLILVGGQVRQENFSCVGMYTDDVLQRMWFDQLFLGTVAIHLEQGVTTYDPSEAAANRTMISRAAARFLMADATKFDRIAPHRVARLEEIQRVITDTRVSTAWVARARDLGVTVERATARKDGLESKVLVGLTGETPR